MNKKNQKYMVGAIALLLLFVSTGTGIRFTTQDIGYSSAFQGPKPSFRGIKMTADKYDNVGTQLYFDADNPSTDLPNIEGEMTGAFIPQESLAPAWVPNEWLSRNLAIKNPQEPTYSWNISGKTYRMEQWVLKWYVSLSASWDGSEGGFANLPGETDRHYYKDTEIWFEIDITPTWYIQGGGTAYFAVASLDLAQSVIKTSKDNVGNVQTADTRLSVIPEKAGRFYIYEALYGTLPGEKTANTYEGKELNRKFFTDKVFAKITLANFGVSVWNEFPGVVKAKGDVVGFDFEMRVFVIGEWKVQDIKKIPTDWVRDTKDFLPPSLADYLSDPRIQAIIGLAVMIGLFILVLLVAPWILVAIISIIMGGRRKK